MEDNKKTNAHLEDLFLSGLGLINLGNEKIAEFKEELIKRGKLAGDMSSKMYGKAYEDLLGITAKLIEDLQIKAEAVSNLDKMASIAELNILEARVYALEKKLEDLDFVKRSDFSKLKKRVEEFEKAKPASNKK